MPATTPYEQVDYQQISAYRPYQLPVNDIFKAVAAQSQYWDEGAFRVKSVYDNALNLSLSKEENKKIRDQYVKDSEQLLAKLSTMNLADPSVQRQGINVYKPLFQDRGIISDHAATEHIREVNADAERARTQEHGKYYSQYNHQYALYGAKEFMDSPDRNAGEAYLKTARNYEDYYDYTSEYKKAMDLCPEDETSTKLPYYGASGKDMTGYMKFEQIKERSVSKAYNCLLSNLSGQAMRQLQIEGSVTYRSKKIEDFAQEVLESYEDQNNLYKKQRQQILAEMTSLNSKDKKLTDQERKDLYEKYNEQVTKIGESISENDAKIEKINKGDASDIYENFDSHAANLYVQKKLYKEAVGMAFRKYSLQYEGDPVQMQKIRQSFEDMMQNKRFNHDFSLKAMDQAFAVKMKQADIFFKNPANQAAFKLDDQGNIVANPNVSFLNQNLFSRPGDMTPGSEVYNDLQRKALLANEALKESNINLFNQMFTKAEQDVQFRKDFLKAYGYTDLQSMKSAFKNNNYELNGVKFADTDFMQSYFKSNKSDEGVVNYMQAQSLIKQQLNSANNVLGIQEKEVLRRLGVNSISELITKPGEEDADVINIGGKNFTGAQIKRALAGETVNGLTITTDRNVANSLLSEEEKQRQRRIQPYAIPGPGEFFQKGVEWLGEKMGVELTSRETDEKNTNFLNKYTVVVDGKRIDPNYTGRPGEFRGFTNKDESSIISIRSIADGALQRIENLNAVRDDVYRDMGANINQTRYIQSYDNSSYFPQQLQSALDNKNISIIGFSGDGEVVVNIPGATDAMTKSVSNLGIAGGGVERVEGTDNFILKGTNYGIINQPVNNPMLRGIANTISTVNYTKEHDNAGVGEVVSTVDVPIWNNGAGVRMDTKLFVIKEGYQNSRYELWLNDAATPLIQSRNSLEFINSFSNLPGRFAEPVSR
jgi:hypothetical protein